MAVKGVHGNLWCHPGTHRIFFEESQATYLSMCSIFLHSEVGQPHVQTQTGGLFVCVCVCVCVCVLKRRDFQVTYKPSTPVSAAHTHTHTNHPSQECQPDAKAMQKLDHYLGHPSMACPAQMLGISSSKIITLICVLTLKNLEIDSLHDRMATLML